MIVTVKFARFQYIIKIKKSGILSATLCLRLWENISG